MNEVKHHNPPARYRADIDGLRAISVLAVVAFHAFPRSINGGFIGVDVFFVISGYLISSIIFCNFEKNEFSFMEFYARRVRRIFPSLILVMIGSISFGWIVLRSDEYQQLGKHIMAGAGFVSNFVLWAEAGYFDTSAETKPLLHLWSLGIEEQFYIVWPLLIWLICRNKINVVFSIAAFAVTSFFLNLIGVWTDSVATFYSPVTRFWELSLGSLLAYFTLYKFTSIAEVKIKVARRFFSLFRVKKYVVDDDVASNFFSLVGITVLFFGFLVIKKDFYFPGLWALFPVSGAIIIIAAGPSSWLSRNVLSNRILVWTGLISYPLYLWHWPLLSFARILEGGVPNVSIRLYAVLIAICLSFLTFAFIERPLRTGHNVKMTAIVMAVSMLFVALTGNIIYQKEGLAFRLNDHEPQFETLKQSSHQFIWPAENNQTPDCVSKFGKEFIEYCLISDTGKAPRAVILGDSNANHLYLGLNSAFPDKNFLMIGKGGCLPFVGLSVRMSEGELSCERTLQPALALLESNPSIKIVVLSMMGAAYVNNKRSFSGGLIELHETSGQGSKNAPVLFEEGMRKTLELLIGMKKKVVFVVSTPRLNFDPQECFNRNRPFSLTVKMTRSPCVMSRQLVLEDDSAYRNIVFRVLKDYPSVGIFDASLFLCDEDVCPVLEGGKTLYRDSVHLSAYGSLYLGGFLRRAGIMSEDR